MTLQVECKKIELMNKNWQVDNFSKFIQGKHGFYNGGKTEKFEIPFLAKKIGQYWSRVHRKMQNRNIRGVCFLRKVDFVNIFMRFLIFEVMMELHYNLKNLKSWLSHENNEKKNQLFLENIPPKCCYSASFGILWNNIGQFLRPKMGFQIVQFFPHYKIHAFPL